MVARSGNGSNLGDVSVGLKPRGIFVALGSNLGDRREHLMDALADLAVAGVHVRRCSSFHETAAVGGPAGQECYLNAVAEVTTALLPAPLLAMLMEIEAQHGRTRGVENGPRTLDLDLLLYHEAVIDEPGLTVPHPRMWGRDFVLAPLAEIVGAAQLEAWRAYFGGQRAS